MLPNQLDDNGLPYAIKPKYFGSGMPFLVNKRDIKKIERFDARLTRMAQDAEKRALRAKG